MNSRRLKLVAFIFLFCISPYVRAAGLECADLLAKNPVLIESDEQALELMHSSLISIFERVELRNEPWFQLLEQFALPSAALKTPLLVAALVGGGNAGKSTLMNAIPALIANRPGYLLGQPVSQASYYPGATKRMVFAASEHAEDWVAHDLQERFGELQSWRSPADSEVAGPGVIVARPEIPPNLVFADSPDFDTGGVSGSTPDNLRQAMSVVCPSDVLIAIFDIRTIRNQANIKLIKNLFDWYGEKKVILILSAERSMPQDQAVSLLSDVARTLYSDPTRVAAGVLGMYLMPYSSAVSQGKGTPELVSLAGTARFPDLVRHMNENSEMIKRFAQRAASRVIVAHSRNVLRNWMKSHLALQIHEQAWKVVGQWAANDYVESFNYARIRRIARREYRKVSSRLDQLTYNIGSIIAVPEQIVGTNFNRMIGSDSIRTQLAADHELHDRLAVSQMLVLLQKDTLEIGDHQGAEVDKLTTMSRRFFELYPEEAGGPSLKEKTVRLPRRSLLPQAVQDGIARALSVDSVELTQRLSRKINDVQFERTGRDDGGAIASLLREIDRRRGFGARMQSGAADLSTLISPALAGYLLSSNDIGFDSIGHALIWAAALSGAARPFHWLSDVALDRFLSRSLDQWYKNLQVEVTLAFFSETILHPLQSSVETLHEEEVMRAFQQIEDAAAFLSGSLGSKYVSVRQTLDTDPPATRRRFFSLGRRGT